MFDENSIEDDDYESQDEQPEIQPSRDRKWVRDLERRAKDADRVRAEADAARRELAFLKAGIDLESP